MSHRFSASVAGQYIACPGSANLELSIPGWQDPVVDEEAGAKGKGHVIHELLAEVATMTRPDIRALMEAIEWYYDLRQGRNFKVLAEASTTAHWLQSKPGTTADVILYTQQEIHIIDWKTGKIPVDAAYNEQLMFYAACFAHLAPKAAGVHLHIVQPWAAKPAKGVTGISSWFATTKDLARFMADARAAEALVLAGDTTLAPSDHCTFCPANPHSRGDKGTPLCPAMMQLLYPLAFDEDEILTL